MVLEVVAFIVSCMSADTQPGHHSANICPHLAEPSPDGGLMVGLLEQHIFPSGPEKQRTLLPYNFLCHHQVLGQKEYFQHDVHLPTPDFSLTTTIQAPSRHELTMAFHFTVFVLLQSKKVLPDTSCSMQIVNVHTCLLSSGAVLRD